jgi:hypothetical protein
VFRRRKPPEEPPTEIGPPAADATAPGGTAAKGRPTPTRKEAEAARRARVKPVLNPREARKRDREAARAERARQLQAMKEGDERYFAPRDRGPVRGFVRDFVDSRRMIAEWFLPGLVLILAAAFTGVPQVVAIANLTWLALLIMVTMEMIWLNRRVKREVRTRFPGEPVKGLGIYAIARATQIRRWRLPKPRLRPGESTT